MLKNYFRSVTTEVNNSMNFYAIILLFLGLILLSLHSLLYRGSDVYLLTSNGQHIYYLGALCLGASPVLALTKILLRHEVDHFSIFCFLIAAAVSLHYLCISNDLAISNDINGHKARIQYMTAHWLEPYSYDGKGLNVYSQSHHPPLYYYFAGFMFWISSETAISDPWTAVRFFSWCTYLIFNVYSFLALRQCGTSRTADYAAVPLLLLWPFGLHAASKISPESMYYALYAISFYHIVIWQKTKEQYPLFMALAFAALTFTVRTNAFFLFVIIGILLLIDWIHGNFHPEKRFLKQYFGVSLILAVCSLINMGNILLGKSSFSYHLGDYKTFKFDYARFLTFDPTYMIARPFNNWGKEQTFFEYLLKTFIFGDHAWPWHTYAAGMNVLLLTILIYTLVGCCLSYTTIRKESKDTSVFLLGFAVPFIFSVVFSSLIRSQASQDARYIFPSLVCGIVFFSHSIENYKMLNARWMVVMGYCMTYSFTLLSVIFFWCNAR